MVRLTLEQGHSLLTMLAVALSAIVLAVAPAVADDREACNTAVGDAASAAARSDPSKISAPDDWCRCSARWRSARRALPRVAVQ